MNWRSCVAHIVSLTAGLSDCAGLRESGGVTPAGDDCEAMANFGAVCLGIRGCLRWYSCRAEGMLLPKVAVARVSWFSGK